VLLKELRTHAVVRKLIAAVLYASVTIATANWLDIALWPEQPYYNNWIDHSVMRIAVAGSVLFGLATLVSFFRLRYAVALGLVAGCLSSPYFAWMFVTLPFSNPFWRVIHDPGEWQVPAVVLWFLAALYSIIEAWKWKKANAPTNVDGFVDVDSFSFNK
jgi:hypothetical protein